jgi:hypothetical protein
VRLAENPKMEDPRLVATKFRLTNEQSSLLTVLHGRSEPIAQMYLGTIIAVNDGQDPERWCKAAHEVRELMVNMAQNSRRGNTSSKRESGPKGRGT